MDICAAVRAKIEADFRDTVRIERLSKKGQWKAVDWTFNLRPSSDAGMICQLVWVHYETKRPAIYRGFKNGRLATDGFGGAERLVGVDGSFSIEQSISLDKTSDV